MPNGESHSGPEPRALLAPYFEWTILLQVFGVAIRMRMLVLATLAVLLSVVGWRVSTAIFLGSEEKPYLAEQSRSFREMAYHYAHLPDNTVGVRFGARDRAYAVEADVEAAPEPSRAAMEQAADGSMTFFGEPVYNVWRSLTEPFRQMFVPANDYRKLAYFLFGGLWNLALWAFFGSAMCRISAMQLARGERVAFGESVAFARRKWPSNIAAVVLPLLGVVIVSLPGLVLGWLMRLDIGLAVGGALYFVILLLSFLATLMAVGLWVGWPLMWAAIGVEASDSFDALSRSFAYVFQRPLHYLIYAVIGSLVGLLGYVLVSILCEAVITLADWAVAWGASADRVMQIDGALLDENASGAAAAGAWLTAMWQRLVRVVGTAYSYAFFFAMMTAVYLLLRRDVDQTETDEIFLDEEDEDLYGLPPLETDEAAVPDTVDQNHARQEEAPQ